MVASTPQSVHVGWALRISASTSSGGLPSSGGGFRASAHSGHVENFSWSSMTPPSTPTTPTTLSGNRVAISSARLPPVD